jgi:hypothetical protein
LQVRLQLEQVKHLILTETSIFRVFLCCGAKAAKKNNSFGLKRQSNFTTNAAGNSDGSPNESTNVYAARVSGVGRSGNKNAS